MPLRLMIVASSVLYILIMITRSMSETNSISCILSRSNDDINKSSELGTYPETCLILNNTSPENKSQLNCDIIKYENFCNCPKYKLISARYYTISDGIAFVGPQKKPVNDSSFMLNGSHLYLCKRAASENKQQNQPDDKDNLALYYVTLLGTVMSILGLILHLIIFFVDPNARNMPGCCLASLCGSLLIALIVFITGNFQIVNQSKTTCVAVAAISYFFILSALLWMNVKAFTIFRTLYNSTRCLKRSSTKFSCMKFALVGLYAWGVALIFASTAVVVDYLEAVPFQYRPFFGRDNLCWFTEIKALWVFFIGPAFAVIGINVIFFGMSVYILFKNRMKNNDSHRDDTKKYFVTYSKLALIMGALWISGFLGTLTELEFFWYIFSILNGLQGLFIFIAFTRFSVLKTLFSKKQDPKNTSGVGSSITLDSNVSYDTTSERNSVGS